MNNQVLVLKKKRIELILLKVGMCKCKKSTNKKKWERIPTEKGAPEIEKEDKRTKVRSKILHMMILGPNTLEIHFGPIILSFVTLSHGLCYVLETPISIKHEY